MNNARLPALLLAAMTLALLAATGCTPPGARALSSRQAGDARYVARDYRGAYVEYSRSIRAASALVNVAGPEDPARTWYNLGLSLEKIGNYTGEREVMRRARELARSSGDAKLELLAARSLAESDGFRGDYPASRQALLELLPRCEKLLSPAEVAQLHRGLAVAAGALGDFAGLKAEAERARGLSSSARDRDGEAAALVLLSSYHASQADYEAGLKKLDEAEAILAASAEPDRAPLLLARAEIQRSRGEYRQALVTDAEASRVARDSNVEEAMAVAESALGLDYFMLGDLGRARERFARSLEIHRALGAKDDEARQLYNLGRIAAAKRNWSEATQWLSQARSLYQSQSLDLGRAVSEMAMTEALRETGDIAGARRLLAAADAAFRASGEKNGQAEVAVELSAALLAAGKPREALAAAAKGLDARDPDLRWRARFAHGRARALAGDRGGALSDYRQAIELLEQLRQAVKVASLQSGFAASRQKLAVYQETVELLASLGHEGEAFEFAERARARAFLDQVGNRNLDLAGAGDPKRVAEARRLALRMHELTARVQQGYASPGSARLGSAVETMASELEALRQRHEEAVVELAASSPRLAEVVAVKPMPLAELQRRLPAETALVEYFVAPDRLYAWVVDRSGCRMTVTTVPADELLAQANLFRVALQQNLPRADAIGRRLHGWLVAPIAKAIGRRGLIVVPHLALHYVPFAALRSPGGTYLVEEHTLRVLPSASALRVLDPVAPVAPSTLVVSGNPTLDTTEDDLPHAEKEVEAIARRFRAKPLVREHATESALRRALESSPDLLHLACHADLDPVNPLGSAILLRRGNGHDGELTVQEVYGLRLPVSVAMLSACDTAMGPVSQGDEVCGLARAFMTAGTRAVVASLWEVNDAATATLVERLYEGLAGGKRAEALRDAQLALLRAPYGPHYWAPFVWQGL